MKKIVMNSILALFASSMMVGCVTGGGVEVRNDLMYDGDVIVFKKIPAAEHKSHPAGNCYPLDSEYVMCAHPQE